MKAIHIFWGLALVPVSVAWSHWAELRHERNFAFSPRAHQWVQPAVLSEQFPYAVAPDQWALNYEAFEEVLFAVVKQDSDGSVARLPLLDELLQHLPTTLKQQDWDRLGFLIQKSLPDERGVELVDVLPRYARYRGAVDGLMKRPMEGSALALAQERFLRTREYRQQYLGAYWHQRLFAEQEATAMMLLNRLQARHESNRDPDTASIR